MTEDADREELLAQLEHLKSLAEKAYRDMYETGSLSGAIACYADARECLQDALRLAIQLELDEEITALRLRLEHVHSVFQSQFN